MKHLLLSSVLLACLNSPSMIAKERQWQQGYWRDVSRNLSASLAVATGTTGTTFATGTGVSFPADYGVEYVVIDGPDGIRYMASWYKHFHDIVINDPVEFVVEGDKLYIKGKKSGEESKLKINKMIRLEPGQR